MQDLDFCSQLLEIQAPWRILHVSIDQSSKRLDIHLGFGGALKKSFFGITRKKGSLSFGGQHICPQCHSVLPKNDELKPMSIRHLPVADFETYLHVPSPGTVHSSQSDCICMKSWLASGTRCTVAMRDHIAALLQQEVPSTQKISQLTGITADELEEIIKSVEVPATTVSQDEPTHLPAESSNNTTIPDIDHPSWQLLLSGKLSIRSNVVALNMLMQHVCKKYSESPGIETGTAGAESLRQFFVRNERLLEQEINQLNNRSSTGLKPMKSGSPTGDDNLPAESDPVWKRLILGEYKLETRKVALQMILARLQRNSNRDTLLTDIHVLRQFFVKNNSQLGREIAQLERFSKTSSGATPVNQLNQSADSELPDEHDPVWGQLINGEIKLQTDTVSFSLLLGRIRQKLVLDGSEAGRIDAARLLRQYFVKNKQRHSNDLWLLNRTGQ